MTFIEMGLEALAKKQVRHPRLFVAAAAIITLVMLSSLSNVRLEGDFYKQLPQGLQAFKDQDKLVSEFGGTDTIMAIIYLDPDYSSAGGVRDIRDPRVIEAIVELDSSLSGESSISSVASPALVFRQTGVPDTIEGVKKSLEFAPEAKSFFSSDYTAAIVFMSADVGTSPEKIDAVTESISDNVERLALPSGVKISVTGSPQIVATIMDMLERDALYTIALAIVLISAFMLAVFRATGLFSVLPILLAVSWMYGTMAWFDIPLSVATVGLGAMILGLSVEYNVFYVERFFGEKNRIGDSKQALVFALPRAGLGIVGSSLTTIAGFLALLLSLMPMLQNLGLALALGIFYAVVVNLVFNPAIILEVESLKDYLRKRKLERSRRRLEAAGYVARMAETNGGAAAGKKGKTVENRGPVNSENLVKRGARMYGEFVARHPLTVLAFVFLLLLAAFYGASMLKSETMDNRDMVPEGIEVIEVFDLVAEKFPGNTKSFRMAIELNDKAHRANITDIREPEILKYADVLSKRLSIIDDVVSVKSLTDSLSRIPGSLDSVKSLLEKEGLNRVSSGFVNRDYDLLIIDVGLEDNYDSAAVYSEVMQALDELKGQKPEYVDAYPVGSIAVERAVLEVMSGDLGKTTIASLFAIFLIILMVFMSIRHTVFSLIAVVFGLIWAFGIAGLTGLPITEIVSGGASMILGIGIDFGIQTVTRFRQEAKTNRDLETVIGTTLAGIVMPLGTTTIVGIIGFVSMSAGRLTVMAGLGTMMIYGIVSCFLAAVTIIPPVFVINERLAGRYRRWRSHKNAHTKNKNQVK